MDSASRKSLWRHRLRALGMKGLWRVTSPTFAATRSYASACRVDDLARSSAAPRSASHVPLEHPPNLFQSVRLPTARPVSEVT